MLAFTGFTRVSGWHRESGKGALAAIWRFSTWLTASRYPIEEASLRSARAFAIQLHGIISGTIPIIQHEENVTKIGEHVT